ncbi:MAG: hypothetical protein FH753_04545 [Firmicutes bacterium]|nr:hypothetical protein [Bacillota bacterium]
MKPNMEQLRQVIKEGNDNQDNRLILNKDGDFELVKYETPEDAKNFEDRDYVTRWETFDAGNSGVGVKASEDDRFLNDIFENAQKAWNKYKKTGKLKILI